MLSILCIVGNCVAQAISVDHWGTAIGALVVLPLTFFVYPFVSPEGAIAFPFADGASLIGVLIIGLIAYPISTFVGGFDPIG